MSGTESQGNASHSQTVSMYLLCFRSYLCPNLIISVTTVGDPGNQAPLNLVFQGKQRTNYDVHYDCSL